MEESKLKYKIALSMIRGVGLLTYKKMISVFGDDGLDIKDSAEVAAQWHEATGYDPGFYRYFECILY